MIRKVLIITGLFALMQIYAASVSGIVSDADTKEALAGVKVMLYSGRIIGPLDQRDLLGEVMTKNDGSYSFDELSSRNYLLVASFKDYNNSQAMISIKAANQRLEQNLAMKALEFGKVMGVVSDADTKEPIAKAKVWLVKPSNIIIREPIPRESEVIDSAIAGLDGSYSFTKVVAGQSYQIRAAATDYISKSSPTFALKADESKTVNMALAPFVPPSGGIAGVVTDAETKGVVIRGAVVVLKQSTLVGGGRLVWVDLATDTTDKEGKYSFLELAPLPMQSMYAVSASKKYYAPSQPERVEVKDEVVTVNIALKPLPMGTMHVFVGKSELYEAPPSAKSRIRNAEVAVTKPEGDSTLFSGITDDDGWVVFKNVPAGTYWVYAEKKISRIDARVTTKVEDDEMDTVIVLLDPILRGTLNIFVGRGVERSGKPVESPIGNVEVSAAHETEDGILYTGLTDEEGWVSSPDAVTGNYTITANKTKAGWAVKTQERKLDENENDTAYILLDLIDPESKILIGTVVNEDDGPIEGAKATLQASQGGNLLTLIASTGKKGVFTIIGIPANYVSGTITVTAPGWFDLERLVKLGEDTTRVELKMKENPISVEKSLKSGAPYMYTSGNQLFVGGYKEKTVMGIYSVQGKLIQKKILTAGQNIVELPEVVSNSVVFVKIAGSKRNMVKRVMVP